MTGAAEAAVGAGTPAGERMPAGSGATPARLELIAFAALLGTSVLTQAGGLDFAWADARVCLSFAAGILLPGYLILRFVRLRFDPDALEWLPLAFAAGLVLQAFWCLAMMNAGGSTRLTARLQTLLTVGLLAAAARSDRLGALGGSLAADLRGRAGIDSRARMLLVALLAAFAYLLSPVVPYAENEEMVIGRKLFENASLTYRNVMHLPDEPTTYLYPVHMFVQAVLAHLAHLDVLLAHVKLRVLLVVLGILIQYALMKGLAGRALPAAAYSIALLALAAFDPNSWSYTIGVLVPFNNRFGVAPWILLPLALYLMLLLYRGVRSAGLVALFVLFLFAAALVHAKEALQVLMIGVGLVVISALLRSRGWRELAAIALGILGAAAVLGLYSRHHHGRVAYMQDLTGEIKQVAREELAGLDPLSARAWIGPVVTRRYDTAAGEYDVGSFGFVVPTLLQHTAGFDFRLGLLLLPVLPFFRRRWQAVFLFATLFVPLLFLRTPMLYLTGAAIVGTTDLELLLPVLAVGSFLTVGVAMAALVGTALRIADVGTRGAPERVQHAAALSFAAAAAAGGFWLARDASERAALWLAADPQGAVLRVLLFSLLATIVAALLPRRPGPPRLAGIGASLERWPLLAAPALLVLLVPVTMARKAPDLWRLAREFAWQRGIVSMERDFSKIARIGNIQTTLSPAVIAFVRDRVGPHRVFATTPSYLNRLVLYTNSYIANAPSKIATASDVAYFEMVAKLGSDPIFNERELLEISDVVRYYLHAYGVEYILVPPDFHDRTNRQLALLGGDTALFEKVYDQDGWSIWRVDRTLLKPDAQAKPGARP